MEKLNNQTGSDLKPETTSGQKLEFGKTQKIKYVSFNHGSKVKSTQRDANKSWGKK